MKGLFDVYEFSDKNLLNHSKVDECFKRFEDLRKWAHSSVCSRLVVNF